MKYPIFIFFNFIFCSILFSQTIDEKIDSLLTIMTLEEKVGQMTQAERGALESLNHISDYGIGSLLSGGGSSPAPNTVSNWAEMYDTFQSKALESNLGIPLLYASDAVHGHNNVYGAVIFPHNIGMGCTWNPGLIEEANQVVAREVAATGIDWTFAPCIAVPRNERWGRTYEGFGETAEIQKIMAGASVKGLQRNDLSHPESILACAKHFVGDGGTTDGIDQGNTVLSENELRSIHMEGYIDAINEEVATIMASYNSWNGVKLHGHDYLLSDVLKNELGFHGFIISDWKGVDQIDEDYRTAIKRAINAGVDMVMVPDRYEIFIGHLISLVEDGEVSESRIDDAVRRILKQKYLLHLFEDPYTNNTLAALVGSQGHRNISRQVVRESMVLLDSKNDVLPLNKNNQTILVAGELANDLGAQCGGWTISWQGNNGAITQGITILEGIQNLTESSEIFYAPNGDFSGSVDAAIVLIGEKTPYAEGAGDRNSLLLDQQDLALLKKLKKSGIPTIALLVSGRPMVFGELLPYSDAMFAVWYPGSEGDGIAEVLFGEYLPTGQLTHSWPKNMAQIPINAEDSNYNPLYAYKHGLNLFPYSDSAEELLPYAATTDITGSELILAISDKISLMNAIPSDFELIINGNAIPNLINDLSISDFDESILKFTLNTPFQAGDEISLSYVGGGISSSELVLNSFDQFFVFNAVKAGYQIFEIPGKIEAEDFFEMSGIQTEVCTDFGGGENVGYIEPGDWMTYQVEVTQSGSYNITGRIAGYAGGTLLLNFNDTIQTELDYSPTDGWQNWENFNTSIYLNQGLYTLKVIAQSNAFNINYFNFDLLTSALNDQVSPIQKVETYPIPVSQNFRLTLTSNYSQTIGIKLIDVTGKISQELYHGMVNVGSNNFNFSIQSNLPAGTYFIEIKDDFRRTFKKIIIE